MFISACTPLAPVDEYPTPGYIRTDRTVFLQVRFVFLLSSPRNHPGKGEYTSWRSGQRFSTWERLICCVGIGLGTGNKRLLFFRDKKNSNTAQAVTRNYSAL
jgi:hypothetical protein